MSTKNRIYSSIFHFFSAQIDDTQSPIIFADILRTDTKKKKEKREKERMNGWGMRIS